MSDLELLDHFAGIAMQGLLARDYQVGSYNNANRDNSEIQGFNPTKTARESYEMAEAMLGEKNRVQRKRNTRPPTITHT